MATHSSVLAWRIPGMGEPGGLPSMGLHRVRVREGIRGDDKAGRIVDDGGYSRGGQVDEAHGAGVHIEELTL